MSRTSSSGRSAAKGDLQDKSDPATTKRFDAERQYLEGLLKDRLNFYLLFTSFFLLGVFDIQGPEVRRWALLAGSLVSAIFFLAVWRTVILIQRTLRVIRADTNHPYSVITKEGAFPGNANVWLLFIPAVLTALFLCLALTAARLPAAVSSPGAGAGVRSDTALITPPR